MNQKYVVGFLFNPEGTRVALIQKQKPAWQLNKFNGIGGKIESGESPTDAMCREFQEESGLQILNWRLFCTLRGEWGELNCFVAHDERIIYARSKTDEKVFIYDVTEIPVSTIPNVRWLIPMALSMSRGEHCQSFDIKEAA